MTNMLDRSDEYMEQIAEDERREAAQRNGYHPDDTEAVRTVPWPTLPDGALQGITGDIVRAVAPHTEADDAAVLVHLLAIFGVMVGPSPYLRAGNANHHALIHPLVVGRTSDGAKGTSCNVVISIARQALENFYEHVASGLSTAEGLIEAVRDGDESDDENADSGVTDKRLLVIESEYRQVLSRSRRDGNTLAPTLRQVWDHDTLRTMTRSKSRLTATNPHIGIIGHITPGEFSAELRESDLSGGSVNRLLICLSRRSKLKPDLGNVPDEVIAGTGELFRLAVKAGAERGAMGFAENVWPRWEQVYAELNRDRADTRAAAATARGVPHVLRLALLYALLDSAEQIGLEHLEAAVALWRYCEDSARWLFSTYELEAGETERGSLVEFIKRGGSKGRSRTDISMGHYQKNKTAGEINAALEPLIHDGVVIEIRDNAPAGGRPTTRYVYRNVRK